MSLRIFEFEDLKWFPSVIREGGTDYLRWLLNFLNFYGPAETIIKQTLSQQDQKIIIDLCSGGGGPWEKLYKKFDPEIKIILTDLYPNVKSFEFLKTKSKGRIDYEAGPVDATTIKLIGFRTMFSAIHHFTPEKVKCILQNAVDSKCSIAIFDGGKKNIIMVLGVLIFHPIAFILCTSFFRPFRLSRIIFTYFIPLIPLYTMWDGLVSIIRLYSEKELLQFTKELHPNNYIWKSGTIKNSFGMHVSFLTGTPTSFSQN